jgi:hypothetical protein
LVLSATLAMAKFFTCLIFRLSNVFSNSLMCASALNVVAVFTALVSLLSPVMKQKGCHISLVIYNVLWMEINISQFEHSPSTSC